MKANEGKKAHERQKRWEEEQRILNHNLFLDRFGKSRDQAVQKFRSSLNESPSLPQDHTQNPVEFDKINNHHINYEFYKAPHIQEQNLSPVQATKLLPALHKHPPIKINFPETPNPGYRHFQQPEYYPNNTPSLEEQSVRGTPSANQLERQHENRKVRSVRAPEQMRDSESTRTEYTPVNNKKKVRNKTDEETTSNLHVPVNKLTDDRQPLKNYVTKQEYLDVIEHQLKEKQAQKQTQKNLEEMQDKLDEIRISHKRLLNHLEAQSASPQSTELPHMRIKNQPITQAPEPVVEKIILQPVYEPIISSLEKLRDEVRENTKKFQDQMATVEEYIKKPIKSSEILWDENKDLKNSDSQGSLKSETQLIPLYSSNLTDVIKPKTTETPVYYDDRAISTPRVVAKSTISASLQNPRKKRVVYTKKLRQPLITNLTSNLQKNVNLYDGPVRMTEENEEDEEDYIERVVADPRAPRVSRVYRRRGEVRPIDYLIDYSDEEPPTQVIYKVRKPKRVVNRSFDESYVLPNDTNTTKFYRPEAKVLSYEPRYRRSEPPSQYRLQKRKRGMKRRQRHGEIEKPHIRKT